MGYNGKVIKIFFYGYILGGEGSAVIETGNLELRVGARLLMDEISIRIDTGDKVGLVGRNGAGKTTLMRVLAGEDSPTSGRVMRNSTVGYLPQDPRVSDPGQTALERILSARDLAQIIRQLRQTELEMADADPAVQERAMKRYPRVEAEFLAAGGYAAEAEASSICSNLALPDRVLEQPLTTLSGGQRRRVELARILFSNASTMLLDEPTNHLDHDSIVWLRDFLHNYSGGLMVISHDVGLLGTIANRVFFLDANRATIDIYNMGWKNYLRQREADEQRRVRERANVEAKAERLIKQANKMKATASKASQAQSMLKRAERMVHGLDEVRQEDKVAQLRFPQPVPCGKTPLLATGLSKSYGSLEIFTAVDLAVDRGSRIIILGLNGAGKTTLLRILAGVDQPDLGEIIKGYGLKIGYYAQEHETLDMQETILENMQRAAPSGMNDAQMRSVLGSFLFSGDDASKPVRVLSGGEKTRLALATIVVSGANVLLLDEPTNNLDPASREKILDALRRYEGSVVLVTHDEGAVQALEPERVVLLPDGDEDFYSDSYLELVSLV